MDTFPWSGLLLAWVGAALLMQALWVVQRTRRDAGVVDVGWAASIGVMAVAFALAGGGSPLQRVLAGALGGLWGLRLAAHLLVDRVLGEEEDGRYRSLRRHWGGRADAHFLWFFQLQALAATVFALPFALLSEHGAGAIAPVQWLGLGLFAVSLGGEHLADRQLARFRSRPENRGRTCRTGLWRYSRHPNYFFEWLVWWAFCALAWPAPHGPWTLAMPAVMYVLITRVSGIPHTEAQAVRSRGDDYRLYQRTTSPLVPWFPREDPA